MRIAGNQLNHLRDFFYAELSEEYDAGEIEALFKLAAEKFLGWDAAQQTKNINANLNQSDLLKLYDCAKDLRKHIPLQYILKEAWFYNLPFYVDASVLIPRPETEELVDLILKENRTISSILDIGTGSGCIPITLKKNRMLSEVSGCDISPEALKVAEKNAQKLKAEVDLLNLDILNTEAVLKTIKTTFGIIVSNPPYIKKSEAALMHDNVLKHEPALALFAPENDDIIFYRQIINLCKHILKPGGRLYFELNPLTSEEVKKVAMGSALFSTVEIKNDMSGKERFLKASRK